MVNNYTVKMTPKAAEDLDNIYQYISEELFAASSAISANRVSLALNLALMLQLSVLTG